MASSNPSGGEAGALGASAAAAAPPAAPSSSSSSAGTAGTAASILRDPVLQAMLVTMQRAPETRTHFRDPVYQVLLRLVHTKEYCVSILSAAVVAGLDELKREAIRELGPQINTYLRSPGVKDLEPATFQSLIASPWADAAPFPALLHSIKRYLKLKFGDLEGKALQDQARPFLKGVAGGCLTKPDATTLQQSGLVTDAEITAALQYLNKFDVLPPKSFPLDPRPRGLTIGVRVPLDDSSHIEHRFKLEGTVNQLADSVEALPGVRVPAGCELAFIKGGVTLEGMKNLADLGLRVDDVLDARIRDPESSWILTASEMRGLLHWAGRHGIEREFHLVHRASEWGGKPVAFHRACRERGPVFIVIETVEGAVFGGFTSSAWSADSGAVGFAMSDSAFLFSLRRPHASADGSMPVRVPIRPDRAETAIRIDPELGACFGDGDVTLWRDCMNGMFNNINLGQTYMTKGVKATNEEVDVDSKFFAGRAKGWLVRELEAFQLVDVEDDDEDESEDEIPEGSQTI